MALQDTNLLIIAAPLAPTFKGTPQELFAEMIRRMKIVSGSGSSFFVISDVEPSSNVGPWLKGGTQWWVFDVGGTNRYIPLDISASELRWYHMGNSTPASIIPPVWLKTERDQTTTDLSFGRALGWYEWTGSAWRPFNSIIASGTTAQRPNNPVEYEEFYDTDISCRIWFERGIWRTVSGTVGEIKQVAFEVLTDALTFNPGWNVLGSANQAFRGRTLVQATKDSGATPATNLTTGAGVPSRAAFEVFDYSVTAGATSIVPSLSLWTLVKE